MKKFTLFIAMTLIALFGVKTTISAQQTEEQIEWIKYAVNLENAKKAGDGIYLCHWDGKTNYTFVNTGGEYGTQAIVSNRGMKLTVNGPANACTFTGTLYNPQEGTFLGMEPNGSDRVFLDRRDNATWTLSEKTYSTTNGAKPYYYITNNGVNKYLSIETVQNTLQVVEDLSDKDRWLLIPRSAFRQVLLLLDVTHQTNIEVSGLFLNTRFVRYMDRNSSWKWYKIENNKPGTIITEDNVTKNEDGTLTGDGLGIKQYGAYRSMAPGAESDILKPPIDYAKLYGNFSAAEMKQPIIMRQEITGVRPGTYTITAQAFVSNNNNDITNTKNIAFLFAAGTNGINQAAEIPVLSENDQTNFTENFYNRHVTLTEKAPQYFRGNVAAGEFLATGGKVAMSRNAIYNPNTTYKTVTLYVTVTDSGDGTGTLTIGATKYSGQGTLYIDNISVKYSGTYEFGIDSYSTDNTPFSATFSADGKLDENNSNIDGIDEYQYGYARQFNLVRDFGDPNTTGDKIANPKWEALVLPVNLTVSQVKNAFGNDVQLSELVGLANNGHQIRFKTVNLDNTNEIAIKAGGCYVIKVTQAPKVGRNDKHEFDIYNSTFDDNKVPMTYYGPIYQIGGVTREDALTELINQNQTGSYANGVVTKIYKSDDGSGSLKFTGYFYWDQAGVNKAYVVSRGKMFYLTTPWKNLTGTMWKLEDDNNGGDKKLSVDFGDGDITNGISDITVEGENNVNATGIYNLNGQKVSDGTSTESLSKGIYIVNGKKYVVR